LTLKRRLAIPREALNASGKFDAGEDVLVMDDPLDEELGANKQFRQVRRAGVLASTLRR
jgi:hypothetical protein